MAINLPLPSRILLCAIAIYFAVCRELEFTFWLYNTRSLVCSAPLFPQTDTAKAANSICTVCSNQSVIHGRCGFIEEAYLIGYILPLYIFCVNRADVLSLFSAFCKMGDSH